MGKGGQGAGPAITTETQTVAKWNMLQQLIKKDLVSHHADVIEASPGAVRVGDLDAGAPPGNATDAEQPEQDDEDELAQKTKDILESVPR
eukprot:10551244-Alexandrium_andersonii.AAC.1